MESIASQRKIQLSTVQSYIAEAMAGIPFCILASLCAHVRAYHKQLLLSEQQQQEDTHQHQSGQQVLSQRQPHHAQVSSRLGQEAQGLPARSRNQACNQHSNCVQQQHAAPCPEHDLQSQVQQQPGRMSPHMQAAAADPAHSKHSAADAVLHWAGDNSSQGSMQDQAVCDQCGLLQDASSARLHSSGGLSSASGPIMCDVVAETPRQQPFQLPDIKIVSDLVVTGRRTKALRDCMEGCSLSYGHMRLALAHIFCLFRLNFCSCATTDCDAH